MKAPRVSVVVPAFNQSGYLAEALSSALAQTMPDLEVIVADDGSTDDTAAVCASFQDSRLHYVHQANDGTMGVGARNRAMLLARGDWIAPLDQDDLWAPQKLQRQLEAVGERNGIGAVFCRVRFIGPAGEGQGEQAGPLPQGDVFHLLLSANRYYVSSGMFRRDLLPRMGVPHESVAIGDWYLWLSVARHTEVATVDDTLVDYRLHPQGFQVAQRANSSFRFWHDHWRFVQAVLPRLHPGCASCEQELGKLRRQIADHQFDVAMTALRRGEFSPVVRQALGCLWEAEPSWVGAPRTTLKRASRLLGAAAAGAWRRAGPGRRP
ncbi:MAG TPA: glycosyltransferase [Burkholderiaceae bacterium]